MKTDDLIRVCTIEDLPPGKAKSVDVDGVDVGVFHSGDEYYAVENTCPHREGYLHEGAVDGKKVTCPWHFAVFDLETGNVDEGPAERNLKTYRVVCRDGAVHVVRD